MAATTRKPSDVLEAWANGIEPGIPRDEVMHEAIRALHAVQEFVLEPVARTIQRESRKAQEREGAGLIPEPERPFTFDDLGRLIAWTDDLRSELFFTLEAVKDVTKLAHEDVAQLAAGYRPVADLLADRDWSKRLDRIHGLDELA